jgi:hypothetical protein
MNEVLNDNYIKILLHVYFCKFDHPTTATIHTQLFPALTKRSVLKMLKYLCDNRYIGADLKEPGKAMTSQYSYYLRVRGARQIGLSHLPTSYYVEPSRPYADFKRLPSEIKQKAKKQGLVIVEEEAECQAVLTNFVSRFTGQYKQYLSLISPDFLLIAKNTLSIYIIAHPNAGRRKFTEKMKQYKQVISYVRLVFVLMTTGQRELCQSSMQSFDAREKTNLVTKARLYIPSDFDPKPSAK